jgi:Zn-finger nucleic acid-binding protein
MLCPVDKIPAIVVEYNDIELDYCTQCRGVWFDTGELELLLASAGLGGHEAFLESVLSSAAADVGEKKRRCPICNLKMKKAYIDRQDKTVVDICPDGHGIWFDGGELERLLSELAAETPGNSEAYQKVIEHFGKTLRAPGTGGR